MSESYIPRITPRVPFLVTLILLLIISSYTYTNTIQRQEQLQSETELFGNSLAAEFSGIIGDGMNLISEILIPQWVDTQNTSDLTSKERFLELIPNYFNAIEGARALNWINSSGVVKYVYPFEENKAVANVSIVTLANGERNFAFLRSQNLKQVAVSNVIEFYQGGVGFAIYFPILVNGNITGFFNYVFSMDPVVAIVLDNHAGILDYDMMLVEEPTEILVYPQDPSFEYEDSYVSRSSVVFAEKEMLLYLRPVQALRSEVSLISQIFLLIFWGAILILVYYLVNMILRQNEQIKKEFAEKEKVKQQMFQSKKLEALGTLAGGIAHDFNNILMSVQGNVSILNDFVYPQLKDNTQVVSIIKDEMAESLRMINQTLERATGLTGQILSYSRHTELDLNILQVGKLVQDTIDIIKQTTDRRIAILEQLNEADGWYVYANSTKMMQILMNVILNAVDAVDNESGEILISVRTIEFNLDREKVEQFSKKFDDIHFDYQTSLLIEIIDNGTGMSQEAIDSAFDPFFTTKELGKGTGLGLAIVHQSITAISGEVSIQSTEGLGTTVSMKIPMLDVKEIATRDNISLPKLMNEKQILEASFKEKARMERLMQKMDLHNKNVLICEDEASIRNSLIRYLKNLGAHVVDFDNGKDALKYYTINQNLALVILDINVPGIDGVQLSEYIREKNPKQPILFITGYSDIDVPGSPYTKLLQKPFSSSNFIVLLAKIFGIDDD